MPINQIWKRVLTIAITTLAVLTTAQSCTIPGINNTTTATPTVLGVLKKGDSKVTTQNFVKANAVKQIDGNINKDGLAGISGIKTIAYNSDIVFMLTQQKGLFKSTEGGRLWERKYIFKVGSDNSDAAAKTKELNAQVARNDALVVSDFAINPQDDKVIYVAAKENKYGKIYKSIDGGDTFNEIYTEVKADVAVVFVTIDPKNPLRVYAVLQGGSLIRSLDGGSSWQKIRSFKETPVQIGFVTEFNNLFFILFPTQGLAYSRDDGENWDTQALTKLDSKIGENQPKDSLDLGLSNQKAFGKYEKIVAVPASGPTPTWILMADKQIWYTENNSTVLTKLVLPLQSEQYNLLDIAPDPKEGLNRLWVSIDDKLFESKNKAQSWSTNNQIPFKIGNIGQILVDENDTNIVYLMIVDSKSRRSGGLLGV